MDSNRSKQHSLKGSKSSTSSHNYHHENGHYDMSSNYGIFRTSKIQRHSLKWRKDQYIRGNHRSKFQYRKNEISGRKSNKSTEDLEEEERKKKLNDTAKKLLSKIKTWNEEKNCNEKDLQQKCGVNQIVSESRCKHNDEKTNSENKPKRIAHAKKAKLVKNRTPKSFSQPSKTTRYEVNKETVKDFQNRIQHKLIEEIMQMPKENLQNVLNDPKINPIMELKMSRLVRENKLLIAQKLRALAESKMKSFDCSANPNFLVDIDKLIDPVIETDLSALPFELIKQMENVFQVQFDYSCNSTADPQVESVSCDSSVVNTDEEKNFGMKRKNPEQNIKEESNEDLSLYECSTDEDEDIYASKSVGAEEELILGTSEKILNETAETEKVLKNTQINSESGHKKRKLSENSSSFLLSDVELSSTYVGSNLTGEKKVSQVPENACLVKKIGSSEVHVSSHHIHNECSQNRTTLKEFSSISCQTECNTEDASTQTVVQSKTAESLYGAPLPQKPTEESISSLLEEVNSIQNLTNKLNERRLMIFLQLARMNPSGSFVSDDITKINFIETVTNGNQHLVESLKQFFKGHNREDYKHTNWSNKTRWRSCDRHTNKNRTRNLRREEK